MNVLKDFPGRRIVVTPGMVGWAHQEAGSTGSWAALLADKTDQPSWWEKAHPAHRGGAGGRAFPRKIYPVGDLREATSWAP